MKIEVDVKPVGNHFKKENIFLGTLRRNKIDKSHYLVEQIKEKYPFFSKKTIVEFINRLIIGGAIEIEDCDIFYKDENGYISFSEEGALTLKGDNSDGKGTIKNLVPIWDYYKEDEVFEVVVNGKTILSSIEGYRPMRNYNSDYNTLEGILRRKRKNN